jgi:hypothetical protein
MNEADLVVDTGLVGALNELAACRCGEAFHYDPNQTEFILRRDSAVVIVKSSRR